MDSSGLSATSGLAQGDWRGKMQQRKQDITDLGKALQSGDLSGAQQAFADLQSLAPGKAGQTGSGSSAAASPLAADLKTLGQALTGGDLSAATDAFSKLQQDMKTAHGGHGHKHHVAPSQDSTQDSDFQQLVASLGSGAAANGQSADASALLSSLAAGSSGTGTSTDLSSLFSAGATGSGAGGVDISA